MSISQFLQEATTWFAWLGLGLTLITLIAFLTKWGIRFRLVGASVFALLLSGSCWAFQESYTPPIKIEGALYVPVVYDNGADLVVAQVPKEFPDEAIQPSLEQIAQNLKGGGRNVEKINVRIRRIDSAGEGISKPVVLGEVIRETSTKSTIPVANKIILKMNDLGIDDQSEGILEMNNLGEENTFKAILQNEKNTQENFESIEEKESYQNDPIAEISEEDSDLI